MPKSNHTQKPSAIYLSDSDLKRLLTIAESTLQLIVDDADFYPGVFRLRTWLQSHPASKNHPLTKYLYRLVYPNTAAPVAGDLGLSLTSFIQGYKAVKTFKKLSPAPYQQEQSAQVQQDKLAAIHDASQTLNDLAVSAGSMRELMEMAVFKSQKLRKQYWSNQLVCEATKGIEALLQCCIQCADVNQLNAQAAKDELNSENP